MSKVLILLFGGMLSLFAIHFGGQLEGKILPVVSGTELTRVEPADPGWTLIWGRSVRERNCSFERLEWRIGTPSHFAVIDIVFLEGSKVRSDGEFIFGPWKVHATEDQIRNRSFATVVHKCHGLWKTETHFYPMRRAHADVGRSGISGSRH